MVDAGLRSYMTSMYDNRDTRRSNHNQTHAYNLHTELGNASLGMPTGIDGENSLD
jgi:hypothetical protein